MSLHHRHSFWGSLSPLGGLSGAGILIMASGRLSWAINVSACLFWVYGLASFAYAFFSSPTCKKIFPKCGRKIIYTCLAAFFGALYMFLFWIMCPLAALETFLLLLLVPLFCALSCFSEEEIPQPHHIDTYDNVYDAVSQAASLAGLLIVFSVIREPLSYSSLSFPGTHQGMLKIIAFKQNAFFPIRIFASSAGAFLLLGYFICLYQYGKNKLFSGENK